MGPVLVCALGLASANVAGPTSSLWVVDVMLFAAAWTWMWVLGEESPALKERSAGGCGL